MVDYIDLKQGQRREFWYLLSNEERSWVLMKAYNEKVLSKEELAPLLAKDRMNNFFTHLLPLGLYPLAYYALPSLYTPAARVWSRPTLAFAAFLAAVPFHIAWRHKNPFRKALTDEREKMLGIACERIGYSSLLRLNEMLPRWMTEFEIHRRLRVLIKRKNGMLAGIIYPPEERMYSKTHIYAFGKTNYLKIVQP